jgi:hypothetical protein
MKKQKYGHWQSLKRCKQGGIILINASSLSGNWHPKGKMTVTS